MSFLYKYLCVGRRLRMKEIVRKITVLATYEQESARYFGHH